MSTTVHQSVRRSLEIDDMTVERSNDGRMLIARALTYGVPYEVSDDGGRTMYHEVWRSGVFDKSMTQRSGRIPLLITHNRQAMPVGAMLGTDANNRNEFVFRAKVSNTTSGQDALELIQDGVLTGISLGATLLNNRRITRGVERVEARLNEISLTPFAQMADGEVLAVRADLGRDDDGEYNSDDNGDQGDPPEALTEAQEYLANLERP